MINAGNPLVAVAGTADITNATVHVGIDGSTPLQAGDRVKLIGTSGGISDGGASTGAVNGQGLITQGALLEYDLDLLTIGTDFFATVKKSNASPVKKPAKALSEGHLAGMALLNQGGDALAGPGMQAIVESAALGKNVFGILVGGALRHDTGSRIRLNGTSTVAGITGTRTFGAGRLTVGAFFEYGDGNYDTHNHFTGAAPVKGKGGLTQTGGGVIGRLDGDGLYAEGSIRFGHVENHYGSADLEDAWGRKVKYDAASAYTALHVGIGRLWQIDETTSIDLYGKIHRTRLKGDSVRLTTGESVKFSDIDSTRVRFGGRYTHALDKHLDTYVGLAYEHEFDGKVRAKANGYRIDAPELKGGTGIVEIGVTLTPTPSRPVTVDFGLQGYGGRREGATGSVRVRYEF
jgi:outer membrane autotransporter protein